VPCRAARTFSAFRCCTLALLEAHASLTALHSLGCALAAPRVPLVRFGRAVKLVSSASMAMRRLGGPASAHFGPSCPFLLANALPAPAPVTQPNHSSHTVLEASSEPALPSHPPPAAAALCSLPPGPACPPLSACPALPIRSSRRSRKRDASRAGSAVRGGPSPSAARSGGARSPQP